MSARRLRQKIIYRGQAIDTSAISVVIPTYGRNQVLIDSVQSLWALPTPPVEIIIVDQTLHHDEGTERLLGDWHDSGRVRWLRLPEPSIPRAMNQGLLKATRPVVLFLDDDIVPDARLVEAHVKAHMERPGDIVAGRVLQPWHDGQYDPPQKGFRFNSLEPRELTEFMGGNFSLSRIAALEIGGFDENFVRVAYRFEAEFAYRWRRSGRCIRYEAAGLIHHRKIGSGGTRTFGDHLTTLRPDHSVGAYYYLFRTQPLLKGVTGVLDRLFRSVMTKHHLRHPWWIPLTFVAELRGLAWAFLLMLRSPRYVARQ